MGEPDENGIYPRYRVPSELKPKNEPVGIRFGWQQVFEHWALTLQDLVLIYGTDLYDPQCRTTWLGLRNQIRGLQANPQSRLWRVVSAED